MKKLIPIIILLAALAGCYFDCSPYYTDFDTVDQKVRADYGEPLHSLYYTGEVIYWYDEVEITLSCHTKGGWYISSVRAYRFE